MNANPQNRWKLGLALLPALSLFGVTAPANAEECGPITCDVGFVCAVYENETEEPFYSCENAPCEADADCGEYMVCGTFETYCGDILIDCAEGTDCASEPAPDCEPGEYKQCSAPWVLPCESASDCGGEGFKCESYEQCDCRPVEEGEEPVCDLCYESEDKWCGWDEIECATADDCPTDWNCIEGYAGTCDSEGNCTDETKLICDPPWDKVSGPNTGGVLELAADGAAAAEGAPVENTATPEDGATASLGDPEEDRDSQATAEESEAARDLADDSAEDDAVKGDRDDADDVMAAGDDPSASNTGCSVGPESGGRTGLGVLALGLGALLIGRRRRNG